MKKTPLLIAIFVVVFMVGCAAVVMALAGIAISITGEFICGELTDNPVLYNLCVGATGVIFDVDDGTIEIQNGNGQWITLTSQPMSFNLLDNSGTQQIMIYRDNIPPGKYNKVRIDLKSIKIQTKDGTKTTLLPNKELVFDTSIEIVNNQKSVVELKVDIAKSLHQTEENKLVFAPVINVKSKKNVNVQVLNQNRGLVNFYGGTILDNRKVGMDLDGKMKKDFLLGKNIKLTINNNKIAVLEPTTVKNQPKLKSPVIQSSTPTQTPIKVTGATIVTTDTQSVIPTEYQVTEQTVVTGAVPEVTSTAITIGTDSQAQAATTVPTNQNNALTTYNKVSLALNEIKFEWKGDWGKITQIDYTIKNNEGGTIKPSYFIMLVEGYDTQENMIRKKVSLPLSGQSIKASESYSQISNVPTGFAYNELTAGDLADVRITLQLYDVSDKLMVQYTKGFNLQGSTSTTVEHIVEITTNGFNPSTLAIKKGDAVKFVNKGSVNTWPASAIHPTHNVYPGSGINKCGTIEQVTIFDACKQVKPSASWSFIFNEIGTWKYHDHLNPGMTGTVIVESGNTKEITILAQKWKFAPNQIIVNKGDRVKLTIDPGSDFTFAFSLPNFNIQQSVAGITTVEFIADKIGVFEFKCSSCEDFRGMKGTIIVVN